MELRHLTSFSAVAEQRSFTQAAARLGLTQAAVSQQVASLEKELGVRLFVRHPKGVQLTEPGERLYGYAQQILDLLATATNDLGNTAVTISGELKIAASTVPAESLLPELLAQFREKFPHATESLVVTDSSVAAASVESGDADIGFVGDLPDTSMLQATPVANDDLCLVAALDHPWATRRRATLKQISREPFIVREPGSGSRRCIERALEEHGISPTSLPIVMEANNNRAIHDAVARRVGVAFLSSHSAATSGQVVTITVRGFHPRRNILLVHSRQRTLPGVARAFLTFVDNWRTTQADLPAP
ncbi:MAG: selenium metabolism-associated LysR family transcriptional regulator [Planctomycetota bacterium]|nr:selenium metabolism-associated LysR family transcriptional regulator [Planctomycetota bacterium]